MKNLFRAVALIAAFSGSSAVFAEESQAKEAQSISFEDAEKMEQLSEQDKQQKGKGMGSFYVFIHPAWYFNLNNIWLPYF